MEPNPRRRRSGKTARRLLLLIFVMMRGADALSFCFPHNTNHPVPAVVGNILIVAIWTTFFWGALWMRQRWARYALMVSVCYVVFTSCLFFTLMIPLWLTERLPLLPWPAVAASLRFAAYLASAVILIRSRAIKGYCDRN